MFKSCKVQGSQGGAVQFKLDSALRACALRRDPCGADGCGWATRPCYGLGGRPRPLAVAGGGAFALARVWLRQSHLAFYTSRKHLITLSKLSGA